MVFFADAGVLLQRFALGSPLAGYVALEHRAGGNTPFKLKEVGSGPPVGFNLQRIVIPGSMFQVVVPQSSEVAVFSERQQQLLAVIGFLLLLAGGCHWWANRRAAARANAELSVFEPAPTRVENTGGGDILKTRLASRAAARAAGTSTRPTAISGPATTQASITQNSAGRPAARISKTQCARGTGNRNSGVTKRYFQSLRYPGHSR